MAVEQMSTVLEGLRGAALRHGGAGLTDGQLLECFVSRGEEAALAALVRRHAGVVWGVCRRVLRNHHDAEDAFQATFLVLVRKAASVMPREMVGNWLYGVAHQTALKARATAAKQRTRERQVAEIPEPKAVRQEVWQDVRPVLDRELSHLPAKYRAPVVLCDLEGKTRREAALQLGVPEGTVAGRLARARDMLAKRLTRHGLAVSAGSLAAALAQGTASAFPPAAVVSSTIAAATLVAAGHAAAVGAISAPVAALMEGVLNAMSMTKFKIASVGLLVVLLAGVGTRPLVDRVLAGRPKVAEAQGRRPGVRDPNAPPAVAGKVVQVAKDGKGFTLEIPPQARGEEAKKLDVKLADATQITYSGVGPDGAKLKEGYHAQVVMGKDAKDVAARVAFQGKDSTRRGGDLTGRVAGVSKDGLTLTFRLPTRVRGEDEKTIDVRLTPKTILTYSFIPKGGTKPAEGYVAVVSLEHGSKDTAARVDFAGDEGRPERGAVAKQADAAGKVVGVSKDGMTVTVEVSPRARGEEVTRREVKIGDKTRLTYQTVGPNGDRPTEGYQVAAWLAEGSKDTADKLVFSDRPKERYKTLVGKVVGVAKDGRGVTLELRPQARGEEAPRTEVKFTDKTRVVYQGVAPGGAQPTEGYFAQVELQDGSNDTAAAVLLGAPGAGRR